MKKILFPVAMVLVLFACSKEGEKNKTETFCPVVAFDLVPQVVKDSFVLKYPALNVVTWFNKDSIGYCAYFVAGGVDKLADFASNGTFIKEETDIQQEGQHEDSTSTGGKITTGCECEIHHGHD